MTIKSRYVLVCLFGRLVGFVVVIVVVVVVVVVGFFFLINYYYYFNTGKYQP